MLIKLIITCLISVTLARDGFRIQPNGKRSPLASPPSLSSPPRFQSIRTRLRGNNVPIPQPAYKIARALKVDDLHDTSSFKERLTSLKSSKAGAELLNRLAQRIHRDSSKGAATEFAGLLTALKSSLTIAGEESESMWIKIKQTCDQADKSAAKQILQLEGQLKTARGAQLEARRSLGKARDHLTTSSIAFVEETESNPKKTNDPKEAWRKSESGKTETYCPGKSCVRTRTTNLQVTTDPSDLVECFNPSTKNIVEITKWHSSMLESKKIQLLNKGYHTGGCQGKDQTIVPTSPKSKLYDVLSKLSTNLQDSNAQPSLENKMAPKKPSTTSIVSKKEIEKEEKIANKEATMETLKSQADGAMTDVAAASAQITSLGSVLNQETQFKLQVQHTCAQKVVQHQDEKLARKDQIRAVNVAIELVHGNLDALQRYLLGKPPTPPPGLKPGESVELLNPEAAVLATQQKKAAAKELEQEKAR